MSYTNLKYVNDIGGISAQRTVDDIFEYFAPGSPKHILAESGAYGGITPYEAPPEPTLDAIREGVSMDMADFIIGLAKAGLITPPEARDWMAGNTIPTSVQNYLDSLTGDPKVDAFAQVYRRASIGRMDPLVLAIGNAAGYTDIQLDNFFGV